MKPVAGLTSALTSLLALLGILVSPAHADGNLNNLQHIVIVMMENHSFDNYFGALPYAPGTPYHSGPCAAGDHACVDGLSCQRNPVDKQYVCHNSNRDADEHGKEVFAFHSNDYCFATDLDHSWFGTHVENNFGSPNLGLLSSPQETAL
jgi:phospholipase C